MQSKLLSKSSWLLIAVLGYVIVFLASRLINITEFPLFIDEVRHILRAQATNAGDFFIGMRDAMKQLFIWLVALTLPIIPDKIFAARLVSVLAGLATGGVCYKLATKLYPERRIGYLALLFYLVSPFALFFDRLALTDTLLAALMGGSIILSLRLWQKPTTINAVLLGIVFALAALTKPYAALYYPAPLFCWFILGRRTSWATIGRYLGLSYAIAALAWIPILGVGLVAFRQDHVEKLILDSSPAGFWAVILANIQMAGSWLTGYLTWPFVTIGLYAVVRIFLMRNRPGLLLLTLVLFPLLVFVVALDGWFSRYLLPVIVPISVLVAWGIADLAGQISVWLPRNRVGKARQLRRVSESILFILLSLPALLLDYSIVAAPAQASLPVSDRKIYIEGRFSGYGLKESAGIVEDLARQYSSVTVVRGSNMMDTVTSIDVLSMVTQIPDADNVSIEIVEQFDQNTLSTLDVYAQAAPTLTLQTVATDGARGVVDLASLPQAWPLASFAKPGGRLEVVLYQWLLPHDLALRWLSQNEAAAPNMVWLPEDGSVVTAPGRLVDISQIRFDSLETLAAEMRDLGVHHILVTPDLVDRYTVAFSSYFVTEGAQISIRKVPPGWQLEMAYPGDRCGWCLFKVQSKTETP